MVVQLQQGLTKAKRAGATGDRYLSERSSTDWYTLWEQDEFIMELMELGGADVYDPPYEREVFRPDPKVYTAPVVHPPPKPRKRKPTARQKMIAGWNKSKADAAVVALQQTNRLEWEREKYAQQVMERSIRGPQPRYIPLIICPPCSDNPAGN